MATRDADPPRDPVDAPRLHRRRFLRAGAAAAPLALVPGAAYAATPSQAPAIAGRLSRPAELPAATGPRAVVLGGGWSGLTVAKYLKRHGPQLDVVLVEKRTEFISFPLSSAWLADQVSLDFLAHSYWDAAGSGGYVYLPATAVGLDRDSRRLYTDAGYLAYDYLVLAPGIDYDYARIGIEDPDVGYEVRKRYPGGFVSASELLSIKRKLNAFRGGTLVLTVPSGDYRCTAAPYERACMAAALFRRRGVKAQILILDMNPEIRIKRDGFQRAFQELYGDFLRYESSALIVGVDPQTRTIETEFDTYEFDDAIIYPPVRASRLLEDFDLHDPASPQRAARTDPLRYHLIGDERVYVTGDARSQPFSKGGHTAHSEGQYVAEVVAAHAAGAEVPWRSPQTMCFSAVSIDPLESMSIITYYRRDPASGNFAFDRTHLIEAWSPQGGQASLAWGEGMFRDLFYE